MAIKTKGKKQKRIQTTGRKQDKIDFTPLAKELGAEKFASSLQIRGSLEKLQALQNQIKNQMDSNGGRPGRKEAIERKKISFSEEEWLRLKIISELLKNTGEKVAPGQVAGALVSQQLEEIFFPEKEEISADSELINIKEMLRVEDAAANAGNATDLEDLSPVAKKLINKIKKT